METQRPELNLASLDVPGILPANGVDDVTKWVISQECERLVALFLWYDDHGMCSKSMDLFTDDGVIKVSPNIGIWKGKGNLLKTAVAREGQTRDGLLTEHQMCNFMLTSVSRTEAASICYMTLYRNDGKPGEGVLGAGGMVAQLQPPRRLVELIHGFRKVEGFWKIYYFEVVYEFDLDPPKFMERALSKQHYGTLLAAGGEEH